MAADAQMRVVRQQVNELIEVCAQAAARGGAGAVRALKIAETDAIPPLQGAIISDAYAAELEAQAKEKLMEVR